MKKYFICLAGLATIFSACQNTQKLINSGNYDEAIDLATRKLIRDKNNDPQIILLEEAYKKDADKDNARILFLKQEGRPENWDEIYLMYMHLNKKQNEVKALTPLYIKSQHRNANFDFVDVNTDLIAAKQKAAEYDYAAAMILLDKGTKADARNAFEKLQNVESLYPDYKDTKEQVNRAYSIGLSHILYTMQNKSGIPLPENFEAELMKITLSDLNRTWLQYDVNPVDGRNYDYSIWVTLKMIEVSPESNNETSYVESREVNDGFQYVLDEKGNVKKDANGYDMKVAKTKTIFCRVTELRQFKKATIVGTLDYVNNSTQQVIKSEQIGADNIFQNSAIRADGDFEALKPETRARVGTTPLPFPPSPTMILSAGQVLKARVKDIIWANKDLLY